MASAAHDHLMNDSKACLFCGSGSDHVPLIAMEYRGRTLHICPQHLPVLIHDPSQLIGLVEGAETFQPSAHHD
jgi:hypothetical protein